jgi:hypothetical protein
VKVADEETQVTNNVVVPWLRRLVAGLSPVSPCGIFGGQSHTGMGFPLVLRFSPVSFIPPVLYYLEK